MSALDARLANRRPIMRTAPGSQASCHVSTSISAEANARTSSALFLLHCAAPELVLLAVLEELLERLGAAASCGAPSWCGVD